MDVDAVCDEGTAAESAAVEYDVEDEDDKEETEEDTEVVGYPTDEDDNDGCGDLDAEADDVGASDGTCEDDK